MTQYKNRDNSQVGAGLIVVSAFLYASYGIWTTLMGDFFQGYSASFFRSIIVLLILFPFALFTKKIQSLDLKNNWKYLLGMFIASLFLWGPLYYAIINAGVSISLAVTYAGVVAGSLIFGKIFAGEKFTKDKALASLLGLVGLIMIFSPSVQSVGWLALVAALVSGLAVGANAVFSKKNNYNVTQSSIMLWLCSVIASVIMASTFSEDIPKFGQYIEWLYLFIFSLVSVLATIAMVKGVKLIDAGVAGIIGLTEIVFGVIFGVLIFSERPPNIAICGIVIIIIAAAIPYYRGYKLKQDVAVR